MTKQIALGPYEGFDITIGDKTYPNFRVMSEWNGMLELKDRHGRVLIVDDTSNDGSLTRLMNKMLIGTFTDGRRKVIVVKASLDLLDILLAEEPEKQNA